MVTPPLTPDAGWMGDRTRGAGLGRSTEGGDAHTPWRFYLERVRLNRGGYDDGGAYWGAGAPLYRYAATEAPNGECPEGFLRAADRAAAKAQILASYPAARFFR